MRILIQLFVVFTVLSSCKSAHYVTVYGLEPAPVSLTKNIKRIGIINEVKASEGTSTISSLEGLVEATDQKLATEGKRAAIEGLLAELQKDGRFDTVKVIEHGVATIIQKGSGQKEVPWDELKALCLANQLDAVFSLAFYETETKISDKKSSMEELDLLRMKVVVPARELTLETLIENGWRIYDPFEKKVLDEIQLNEQMVTQAKGDNPLNAFRAMTDRTDSLVRISRGSGSTYGARLKPITRTIQREVYLRGSDLLVQSKEAVLEEDWLTAAHLWQNELNNDDLKVRAMASHNMAVLYEFKGDLIKAIEWATQALSYHEDKAHFDYLEALKERKAIQSLAEKELQAMALLKTLP
jgi:hypothetical protein